jgi:hypothetical protein
MMITRLAEINATGEKITTEEFLERKEIVDSLQKEGIIELGVGGNFLFTSEESQSEYVKAFEKKKIDIAREVTTQMEGIYMLIKWPESQLLMDEEWFETECHIADMTRDPEVGSSAYFVPVKRMVILEEKLNAIKNESQHNPV